jgi:hypothetical protein
MIVLRIVKILKTVLYLKPDSPCYYNILGTTLQDFSFHHVFYHLYFIFKLLLWRNLNMLFKKCVCFDTVKVSGSFVHSFSVFRVLSRYGTQYL